MLRDTSFLDVSLAKEIYCTMYMWSPVEIWFI